MKFLRMGLKGGTTMEHIGIDLGSRDSQVCVRDAAGEIREECRCRTNEVGALLANRLPARVVLETCTEAFRVAGIARGTATTYGLSPRCCCGPSGSANGASRTMCATHGC